MVKKKASEYTADELEVIDAGVEEQEVVLQKSRDEDRWSVWVTDNLWFTKLKNLMKTSPELYRLENVSWNKEGRPTGYEWSFPKKLLTLRSKEATREMSEEQKEAARARLKAAREKKAASSADNNDNTEGDEDDE